MRMNFLIGANVNSIRPLTVLLYSICKNHEDHSVGLYIAGMESESAQGNQLKHLIKGFDNVELDFLEGDMSEVSAVSALPGMIEKLPENIDRILWLDVNCLVKGKLDSLFDMDIRGFAAIVCRDMNSYVSGTGDEALNICGIDKRFELFSTEVMMLNLNYWRRHNIPRLLSDSMQSESMPAHLIFNRDLVGRVLYANSMEYGVSPCFFRLSLPGVIEGKIEFLTYEQINSHTDDAFFTENMDITSRVLENSGIITYCREESRPWLYGGENVYWVYRLYHPIWFEYEELMLKALRR